VRDVPDVVDHDDDGVRGFDDGSGGDEPHPFERESEHALRAGGDTAPLARLGPLDRRCDRCRVRSLRAGGEEDEGGQHRC
jgi:hypothetical protein